MLSTRYQDCAIFVGGDKNKMDISSLMNNNLKLKQIVGRPTRKLEILDILLTNCFSYYNAPTIIPPVQPDIPGQGVPSDHSVPLCVPHTDPLNPPTRQYRTIISRPLPDSKVREFGQWITVYSWDEINQVDDDPSEKVRIFEEIISQKLDTFFPQKITKLGVCDYPFITSELKTLKRRRMREYKQNLKSVKYFRLKAEYDEKFEKASENFLRKNIDSLKETNPGQAYSILKRMGAQPGENEDTSTFSLPSHEHLSPSESAEKIAEHFSKISREFPPIDVETLPERVTVKLCNPERESEIPDIREYEVYDRIKSANKPKSGVPGDLPRRLINEFGPELAKPICNIFNKITSSAKQGAAKWPSAWKLEFGTPLQKMADPLSEDDLRIISLTAFFSKVMEKFVVEWLMSYIGNKMDPKQFGGLKGNSISHYVIELINFILYNQDYNLPIGVMACAVDFSKAFNRQNHNLLITKLSDMGVPGWLLNIVMGFLADRYMVVRFKGQVTEPKHQPGGGPQGTLLGLLLFLILINSCGFENQETSISDIITNPKKKFSPSTLHTKYVDDLTILESFNLEKNLVEDPERPLPDNFHARLGQVLPPESSKVYEQIQQIEEYAVVNQMKLNSKKSKFMVFNPTDNFDFEPHYEVEGKEIETVEQMKLLGLIISNDLKWKPNTDNMIKKAYARMWMVKRLKKRGANLCDINDIYVKQIRSILEFGAPVWNSGITNDEKYELERVQKSFLHIAFGTNYGNYETALDRANLDTLESRRE